jgi:hypothetical protein
MGPISCAWLWAFLQEIADGENHRLRQPAEFGLKLSGLEVDIEETSPVWDGDHRQLLTNRRPFGA